MKHLLILISFFLLSSPVIGDSHKGETLYKWGEKPDYKWMGFGDKDTHPVYKGQVENGKPNGLGVSIHPKGWKYVGSWKNGKEHGYGTGYPSDGGKYEGGWKNGDKHGPGIQTDPNGTLWMGEWGKTKDYDQSFQGTVTFPDGDKYVGEVRRTVRWWDGTYYDKDGNIDSKCVNGRCIKQ